MTEKRYDYSELKDGTYGIFKDKYYDDNDISFSMRLCEVINEEQARSIVGQLNGLAEENEQLKKENKKLHSKIFEMRTNEALERTEISKQGYSGYKTKKEFLKELEKW